MKTIQRSMQSRMLGALGAVLATAAVAAALHGYAAFLQRDAALEVVTLERVVITASAQPQAQVGDPHAKAPVPHVGEI